MIIACSYITHHYTVEMINECTSNPLVYGAMKWDRDYQTTLYGSGHFSAEVTSNLRSDYNRTFFISFNSSGVRFTNEDGTTVARFIGELPNATEIQMILDNITIAKEMQEEIARSKNFSYSAI